MAAALRWRRHGICQALLQLLNGGVVIYLRNNSKHPSIDVRQECIRCLKIHRARRLQHRLRPLRHFFDQGVTGGKPQRLVDGFEPRQVKQHQAAALATGLPG